LREVEPDSTVSGAAPLRTSAARRRREHWLVSGMAALAALLRLAWVWAAISHVGVKDIYGGFEVAFVGASLATGHGFSDLYGVPSGPTAWFAPIYPLIVSLAFRCFRVFSAQAAWSLFALNILCEAITVVLVYWIGRRCFGPMVAFAAALLWAIDFATVLYAVRIWESSLSALLATLAAAWSLLLLDSAPRRRDWIGYGLFWGCVALTNTTLIAIMPFAVAGLFIRWGRRLRRDALLALLVFCCALTPWTVRNYVVFHKLIPIRGNFGPNLWYGNRPDVQGPDDETVEPTQNRNELQTYVRMGELQYVTSRQQMALQCIRQDPARFARLTRNRILFFWAAAGPGATRMSFASAGWSILAFAGLWMLWRRERITAMVFAGALLLYPLPYYLTLAAPFYRHAIDPLITLLAFNACFTFWEIALARLSHTEERRQIAG